MPKRLQEEEKVKSPPEPVPSWKAFFEGLRLEMGQNGERATYETLSARLKVSPSYFTEWRKGFPPQKALLRSAADNAGMLRSRFFAAAGYQVPCEDEEWDRTHFPGEYAQWKAEQAFLAEGGNLTDYQVILKENATGPLREVMEEHGLEMVAIEKQAKSE